MAIPAYLKLELSSVLNVTSGKTHINWLSSHFLNI